MLGSPEHRALAREVAARSVVLLRNEPVDGAPVLPLAADGLRVAAVLGRLADAVNLGDGGSSDVWDLDCRTVLDGLRGAVDDVVHDDGTDIERAAAVAAGADVAVVVVGLHVPRRGRVHRRDRSVRSPTSSRSPTSPRWSSGTARRSPRSRRRPSPPGSGRGRTGFGIGGDRTRLRLPEADVALIRAVAAANPRTVVAIQAGSAVVATEWIDAVPAVVQAWYGGCQAGPGLADVLLGAVNPSARLPFSVPADEADLPPSTATPPTSSTTAGTAGGTSPGPAPRPRSRSGSACRTPPSPSATSSVEADAARRRRRAGTVRNTGDRDGADVVQVYAELPDPDAPARLVGFARVEVPAGGEAPFRSRCPSTASPPATPNATRGGRPPGTHRFTVARFAGDPDAATATVEL